ncbi:MAG: hypothetical protein S4CHLAM102_07050 [Chlamydiia bacterium]|nr:hypothetical protein [Chlamydiia bacterium]
MVGLDAGVGGFKEFWGLDVFDDCVEGFCDEGFGKFLLKLAREKLLDGVEKGGEVLDIGLVISDRLPKGGLLSAKFVDEDKSGYLVVVEGLGGVLDLEVGIVDFLEVFGEE